MSPAVSRFLSNSLRVALAIGTSAVATAAQTPSSGAKPRLELADTVHRASRSTDPAPQAAAPRISPAAIKPAPRVAPAQTPPPGPETSAPFRADFVKTQALLGVGIYGPSFATLVARDGLSWAASYLLVAGGSFVGAAELSRQVNITDPMQRLALGMPIRAALAGSMLATTFGSDPHHTAGAILFSSVGGTAAGLLLGRNMTDGEAAATLFGSDALALEAFAVSTASGLVGTGAGNKSRALITVAGLAAGAPLGQAYAALAPYNVTVGDLSTLAASAGVGMLGGMTVIADHHPADREVAAALAIGGAVGLVIGDRMLVRVFDHTPAEGRLVMVGGLAGGLMGAGVAMLTGGAQSRFSTLTGIMTTAGAAGGIALSQRYLMPKADGALRLGGLTMNPIGMVAAAAGMRGSYTLGSLSF
jgi:hypothetical protein